MEQKTDKTFFVAVITNKFLANSTRFLNICSEVETSNENAAINNQSDKLKPMYAIIKEGVDWSQFQKFSWRLIWFFKDEKEFDKAWKEMTTDANYFTKTLRVDEWIKK
jgi:hypothetical protein